jgi:hypothetical protein
MSRLLAILASMAYTTDQLTAIEAALAAGTLRVEVAGRMVQYQSVTELIKLRDLLRAELGEDVPTNTRGRAWRPITSRGIDG